MSESSNKTLFFEISSKLVMSYFLASLDDKQEAEGFDLRLRLFNGQYEKLRFPIRFKQTEGKKLTDILDTGYANLYLISDRLKSLMEESEFSGFTTYPVEVRDKKDQCVPGYHGLSFVGRCGTIDYSKSQVIEKRMTPQGPLCKFYKGIVIDNWDGSDFFSPSNTLHTFVTERVVKALKKHKFLNLKIDALDQYETSSHIVEMQSSK